MLSDNSVIAGSVAISIVLHIVIVPELFSSEKLFDAVSPSKSTHLETENKEPVVLGIDESNTSTLTWIGYNEYKLHMAQFSQYEQASMVAVDDPTSSPKLKESPKKLVMPLSDFMAQLVDALRGIEITFPSREVPVKPLPPATKPNDQSIEVNAESSNEAAPSDRDSMPTSIIKVSPDVWKSGKPLAAEGVVLRPRKPSFTANQLVTNAPSDLVAELHINSVGKPVHVEGVLSTGSQSIDLALIASLYRWRASGDRIDALADDETLTIKIHITFSSN